MASRKTYFGIGWKDPADPESGPAVGGKTDPADRSSPTIVDDEKVAEGLRQLRSWYQGDTQQEQPAPAPAPAPAEPPPWSPASTLGGSQARPTAVGHATGPPPSAAPRPFAPDPMRATMYGHDVHQFDLDVPSTGATTTGAAPATPPASSTALVLADPSARQQDAYPQAMAVPTAAPLAQSDAFQFAGGAEAQRLQRPGLRRSQYDARPAARVPVASRVMFAIGIVSLLAAVTIWLVSGSGSETPTAEPTSAPAAVPTPATPATAPALTPVGAPAPTTAPPAAPPAPIPAATAPKDDHPRPATTPATLRSPRRPKEAVKVENIKVIGDEPGEQAASPKDESKPPKDESKPPKAEAKPPKAETRTPKTEIPLDKEATPPRGRTRPIDTDETLPPSEE